MDVPAHITHIPRWEKRKLKARALAHRASTGEPYGRTFRRLCEGWREARAVAYVRAEESRAEEERLRKFRWVDGELRRMGLHAEAADFRRKHRLPDPVLETRP